MTDLSAFEITRRWPARHPDRIQLYSLPTPNGVKASIMLEETGLPYEWHLLDFAKDDQKTPEFLSLNPNGKIPAMLDPDGPNGAPLELFESGAILLYLAEKSGKLLLSDPAESKRLLAVMDGWLAKREWFVGNAYSIADISMLGWVRNLIGFYDAADIVGFSAYKNVSAWLERGLARPAVQRGLDIPPQP